MREDAKTRSVFELVFENALDEQALLEVGPNDVMRTVRVNGALVTSCGRLAPGLRAEDLIGTDPREVVGKLGVSSDEIETVRALIERAVREKQMTRALVTYQAIGVTLDVRMVPVLDEEHRCTHVFWVSRDVTEERRALDRLARELEEKELLLREIHHRVKNNLQIVSSLLYLQELDTPELATALAESRRRLDAMATVHRLLYVGDGLGTLDVVRLVHELAGNVRESFRELNVDVTIELRGRTFALSLDRAIPFSLILVELFSAAVISAKAERCDLEVELRPADRGHRLELRCRRGGDPRLSSLGTQLVPGLLDQLRAHLSQEHDGAGAVSVLELVP